MQLDELQVTGLQVKGLSNTEEGIKPLAAAWSTYFEDMAAATGESLETIQDLMPICVYTDYSEDHKTYTAVLSVEGTAEGTAHPDQLRDITLPAGEYIAYELSADTYEEVIQQLAAKWEEINQDTKLKRTYVADADIYINPTTVTIFVGVEA